MHLELWIPRGWRLEVCTSILDPSGSVELILYHEADRLIY